MNSQLLAALLFISTVAVADSLQVKAAVADSLQAKAAVADSLQVKAAKADILQVKAAIADSLQVKAAIADSLQVKAAVNDSLQGNAALADSCSVADGDKVDCGHLGSNQADCEASGCCWVPVSTEGVSTPWCFYPGEVTGPPSGDCSSGINWNGQNGPGFTDEYYNIMYNKYKDNLNVQGSGAVVAAPDNDMGYYYHWMRDAGLSIKVWLDINNNDYSTIREEVAAYAAWVAKVQQKADPNGIDVRVEPKFTIPDGEPYTGGWCRPQTDGPALRAMALAKWGRIVMDNNNNGGGGGDDEVSAIWQLVKYDLEWVVANWASEGCDLWEEVASNDFFFNRMAYIYSLNEAAVFAEAVGGAAEAGTYRATADEIRSATVGHWRDGFLYEATNRPYDGAVVHAVATFGEYLFPPESAEAAATVNVLARVFCEEYPLNRDQVAGGRAGVLIGRYPGDSYQGGNPWQLLSAALGELFYLGGQANLVSIQKQGGDKVLGPDESEEWRRLLHLPLGQEGNVTRAQLAAAQLSAGDAVMSFLFDHVQDAGGRVDEQIDKYSGAQTSAKGLTWSYANILHALHVRKGAVRLMDRFNKDNLAN